MKHPMILLITCILFVIHVLGQNRQKTFAGQNVRLQCIPPNFEPNDRFYWIYDNKQQIAAKEEFKILNVTLSDSGVYECNIAREIDGTTKIAKQSVYLQVIQPQSESTTQVQEGTTVRLQCVAGQNVPENVNYTWYNPDGNVISNSDQAVLGGIRLNEAGKYVCQALKYVNGQSQYASQATNIVVVPTSEIKFNDLYRNTKEVVETGYVHQTCSVNAELANGNYDYHWNDPTGRRVSDSSVLRIEYALKEQHSGTYECVATPRDSILKTISGQMHLVVKPLRFDVTTLQEDNRIGGYSDKKITLSYLPMPKTATREEFEYYWYNPSGQKLNDYSRENMRLQLSEPSDFGVYTIRVKGKNSDYQTELKIQVFNNGNNNPSSKSKIVITYQPYEPKLGQSLDLTCNFEPKPYGPYTTRWIKSNGEVISTNAHLSLPRLKETDIDDLNCEIVFDQTKYTGKVELTWKREDPPITTIDHRVTILIEPSRYKFGDYVILKCNVEPFNPSAIYTWFKDGIYAGSSKEYKIERFSQNDIGFYHCKSSINGIPVTSQGAGVKPEQASLTIMPYPINVRPRNTFEFRCISNDPNRHPELYTESHKLLSSDPRFSVRYEGNAVIAVSTRGLTEEDMEMLIFCKAFNAKDETIVFNQQTTCQNFEGMCRSGQCIPNSSFCNGVNDCYDGSDEEKYYCSNNQIIITPNELNVKPRNRFTFTCSVPRDQTPVMTDAKNIPLNQDPKFRLRNINSFTVEVEAIDGLQEIDGEFIVKCQSIQTGRDKQMTIKIDTDCSKESCRCREAICLSSDLFCDGKPDCPDGSDELPNFCEALNLIKGRNAINIWPSRIDYSRGQRFNVTCESTDGSNRTPKMRQGSTKVPIELLPYFRVINTAPNKITAFLERDIDEHNLPLNIECYLDNSSTVVISSIYHIAVSCRPGYEMSCRNGQCMPITKFCDGARDCIDGSDEEMCKPIWTPLPDNIDPKRRLSIECESPKGVVYAPKIRNSKTGQDLTQDPRFKITHQGNKIYAIAENGIEETLSVECYMEKSPSFTLLIIHVISSQCPYETCDNGRVCLQRSMICDGQSQCIDQRDEQQCKPKWSKEITSIRPNREFVIECETNPSSQYLPKLRDANTKYDLEQDSRFVIEKFGNKIRAVAINGLPSSIHIDCYTSGLYENTMFIKVEEDKCTTQHSCDNGRKCLAPNQICDKIRDCIDGSDEASCAPSVTWISKPNSVQVNTPFTISCRSDAGLPKLRDSSTRQDITNLPGVQVDYSGNIATATFTQGITHFTSIECYNDKDKILSYISVEPKKCSTDQHSCDGSMLCIDKSKLCDSRQDCRDNSDESNCRISLVFDQNDIRLTKDDEIKITCRASGGVTPKLRYQETMIPLDFDNKWVITQSGSGVIQAVFKDLMPIKGHKIECFYPNASSDFVFVEVQCPYNERPCADYTQCVPTSNWCDKRPNCQDGSDERSCASGGDSQFVKEVEMVVNQTDRITLKCIASGNGEVTLRYHGTNEALDSRGYFRVERISPSQVNAYSIRDLPVGSPAIKTECVTDNYITLTKINVLPKCNNGYSRCRDDQTCIPNSKLCDSFADCPSGSDEEGCQTMVKWTTSRNIEIPAGGHFIGECTSTGSEPMFRILINGPMPSDFKISKVADKKMRIEGYAKLDYMIECYNNQGNSDTMVLKLSGDCLESQFTCKNGGCIDKSKVCNGVNDCRDDSDEDRYQCLNNPTDNFQTFVIYTTQRNETSISCGTSKPGTHFREQLTQTRIGEYPHFTYKNQNNNYAEIYNDGTLPISTINLECVDGDGKVFQRYKIIVQCDTHEKMCLSGDECIDSSLFCDGKSNCRDGSDENPNLCPTGGNTVRITPKDGPVKPQEPFSVDCVYQSNMGRPEFRVVAANVGPSSVSYPSANIVRLSFDRGVPSTSGSFRVECVLPDGTKDVSEITITKGCGPNERACRNGRCIPKNNFCDGRPDCSDGSDESLDHCSPDENTVRITPKDGPVKPQEPFSVDCVYQSNMGRPEFRVVRGNPGTTHVTYPSSTIVRMTFAQGVSPTESSFRVECVLPDGTKDVTTVTIDKNSVQIINPKPTVRSNERFTIDCVYQTSSQPPVFRLINDKYQSYAQTSQPQSNTIRLTFERGLPSTTDVLSFECRLPNDVRDTDTITVISACGPDKYACQNGQCIDRNLLCNGRPECSDGSDESPNNCPNKKGTVQITPKDLITKPNKEFSVICIYSSTSGQAAFRVTNPSFQQYAQISYPDSKTVKLSFPRGLPSSASQVYLECVNPDGSKDTSKVTIRNDCSANERACSSGQCIHATKFCDGQKDCSDGSDEVKENCQNTCQPLTRTCGQTTDTFQISWKCDGEKDCHNGFDEENCSNYERIPGQDCGGTHFKCTNEKKIPFWYQCDGNNDCGDESDESNCGPPTILNTVPAKEIHAKKGETVRLECNVSGTPLPIVIWRYNWGCLLDESRMISSTHTSNSDCRGSKSILTITNLRESDAGLYNCEAISSNNRALSQEMQLFVI